MNYPYNCWTARIICSITWPDEVLQEESWSGIRKFCDYHRPGQFFPESIIDVFADGLVVTTKQYSQLLTGQPNHVIFQPRLKLHGVALVLVYDWWYGMRRLPPPFCVPTARYKTFFLPCRKKNVFLQIEIVYNNG